MAKPLGLLVYSPLLSNCVCVCVHRSAVLLHQLPTTTVTATIRGLLQASNLGLVQSVPTGPVSGEQRRPTLVLIVSAGRAVVSAAHAILPRPDHFESRRLFSRPAPTGRLPLGPEPPPANPSCPTGLFLTPSRPYSLPFKPLSIA